MRALTGSFASALLLGVTVLVPPPPAQSHTVSSQPVSIAMQSRAPATVLVVGPSDSVGALVAGAVRDRLASDTAGRPIWVIHQRDIDENLRLAGFAAGTPISEADRRQLANFMRADLLVSLSIEQSAGVLRVSASVAGRTDAAAHDLSQNIVGNVDAVGDQVAAGTQTGQHLSANSAPITYERQSGYSALCASVGRLAIRRKRAASEQRTAAGGQQAGSG